MGRSKPIAKSVAGGNAPVIEGRVPTWKMDMRANPELSGAKNADEFLDILKGNVEAQGRDMGVMPEWMNKLIAKDAYKALGKGTANIRRRCTC